jgi:hypothetical protein
MSLVCLFLLKNSTMGPSAVSRRKASSTRIVLESGTAAPYQFHLASVAGVSTRYW